MTGVNPPMGTQAMLSLDGLRALIEALGRDWVIRCSARPCAMAPSSMTRSRGWPTCPPDGPTSRMPAGIGSNGAPTTRCLATPSARNRGGASCIRRSNECGRRSAPTDGFTVVAAEDTAPKFAFLGVRACEIHAIAIQDKVFVEGPYVDTGLSAAPPGQFHRRGELRRGRRHLLLRVDEHRPEGRTRVSISR